MGKIFDALKKKADPLAERVLNPSAMPTPTAPSPVPASGEATDSALAAVLAGASMESKKATAEIPAEPPPVSAESGAKAVPPGPMGAQAELPPKVELAYDGLKIVLS